MDILKSAEVISQFCRLNINMKKNLPLRASHIGFLIYLLDNNDGNITPVDAAHFFSVTKAVITKKITPLVEQGYITKTPSLIDKRSYTISANEKAKTLVENSDNEYYKIMKELSSGMGDEKYGAFIRLMQEANDIINNMDKEKSL